MQDWNAKEPQEPKPCEPVVEKKKGRLGCVFSCCLLSILCMILLIVVGGFAGYFFVKGQITKYTSATPANLPTVKYTEEELTALQARITTFKEAIEKGEQPEDLVLTVDDINALIAKEKELRGRVYVKIKNGQVAGEVSIPTDFVPGGKGRFFNASATFNVSMENGVLIVTLAAAEVKGKPVPQQIVEGIGRENLAKDIYKDPDVAETLRKFETLVIEKDRIVLKPRLAAKKSGMRAEEASPSKLPSPEETPAGKETETSPLEEAANAN